LTVTTDYWGNKVYVNSQLKYILTEEGYFREICFQRKKVVSDRSSVGTGWMLDAGGIVS
jgi:predicted nucleotidyltransferase